MTQKVSPRSPLPTGTTRGLPVVRPRVSSSAQPGSSTPRSTSGRTSGLTTRLVILRTMCRLVRRTPAGGASGSPDRAVPRRRNSRGVILAGLLILGRGDSPAGQHDVVALGAQDLHHGVAVVALQLDH